MAQQTDESTSHYGSSEDPNLPHVSYDLQWTAYERCKQELELILEAIVEDPKKARFEARGMYELMHAVMDSYSKAHTERDYANVTPGTDPRIRYLKVWQPTVPDPFTDASRNSRHEIFEPRDDDYIDRFRVVDGRPCTDFVGKPYSMPPGCLSDTGRLAVNALKDLAHLVVDLRRKQKPRHVDAAWEMFVQKHLAHVERPARLNRNPPPRERDTIPFLFLGTRAQFVPAAGQIETSLFLRYILTSGAFDPLTLAASVEVGSRRVPGQANELVLREDIDTEFTLGNNIAVGLTPLSFETVGVGTGRLEVASRAVRLDWFEPFALRRVALSLWGPVEYAWFNNNVRWSFGFGVSGALLEQRPGAYDRRSSDPNPTADKSWNHPPPWDSELRTSGGLRPRFGVFIGATSGTEGVVVGQSGKVEEGLEVSFWKRNPWDELRPLSTSVLVGGTFSPQAGSPPGLRTAVTAFVAERWYPLNPLGLTVEVGYASRDLSHADAFPQSVQTRGGLVLTIGQLDIVLLSPSLPRFSFLSGELFTARIVIEL